MAIIPGKPGLTSFIEAKDDRSGGDNCYSLSVLTAIFQVNLG